jgi:elongation factor Ts
MAATTPGRLPPKYPHSDKSVADTIKDAVGTIGENLNFRRSARLAVEQGEVATYMSQRGGRQSRQARRSGRH